MRGGRVVTFLVHPPILTETNICLKVGEAEQGGFFLVFLSHPNIRFWGSAQTEARLPGQRHVHGVVRGHEAPPTGPGSAAAGCREHMAREDFGALKLGGQG